MQISSKILVLSATLTANFPSSSDAYGLIRFKKAGSVRGTTVNVADRVLNYIAHIHLAQATQTSLLGNFLGDFVKGNDLSHLPIAIQTGVRLHRKIDVFTDTHPLVRDSKRQFPPSLRRMSGVVMDVYFDYLLCQFWTRFSEEPLNTVLAQFYQELSNQSFCVNGRFIGVRQSLLERRWLSDYQQRSTCFEVFRSIERRLHGRITFAKQADIFIEQHQQYIEQQFLAFYPQLIQFALDISDQH